MEEKGHFINALPDSGLVTFLAVVRERELRPRRSGGVYLHLLLGDRTGEIQGRVWTVPKRLPDSSRQMTS